MTLPRTGNLSGPRSRSGAFDIESAPAPLILLGRAITLVAITMAPWFFGCVRFQEQVWFYSTLLAAAVVSAIVAVSKHRECDQGHSLLARALRTRGQLDATSVEARATNGLALMGLDI